MNDVENLSDREAVAAVRSVVAHWAEARGLETLVAWQAINSATGDEKLPAPLISPEESDPAAAIICRKILTVIVDGNDPQAR
jgi:hypothetical protein